MSFLFAFSKERLPNPLYCVVSLSAGADLGKKKKNHLKDDLNKDLQLNGNDEVVGRLLSTETYKQDFKSPPSLFK